MDELITKNFTIKAKQFAREAHEGLIFLTASGYKKPQFEHLQEVADLVWVSGGDDIEVASAWLHDVVEDTPVTVEDLRNKFCEEIASIVEGLTDGKDIEGLALLERKTKQAERVKGKSKSIRMIKIADQTSNVKAVTFDGPHGWSRERNREYVMGAKLVADNCRGLNQILDNAFDREYKKAADCFEI